MIDLILTYLSRPHKTSISQITTWILVAGWIAALWKLPIIISMPCIFVWSFISVKQQVIDGYVRLITGVVVLVMGAWNVIAAYRTLNGSKLVQYAQFMLETQYLFGFVSVLIGSLLAASGGRSLLKSSRKRKEVANVYQTGAREKPCDQSQR